jgi:uncharacterized protein YfaP (DUF2135 family)
MQAPLSSPKAQAEEDSMFERRTVSPEVSPAMADAQAAYERGRIDERAARRRHPVMMTVLWVLALAGAAILAVAGYEGSFSRGGQVVDRSLSIAADRAEPTVRGAAVDARQALHEATAEQDRTAP